MEERPSMAARRGVSMGPLHPEAVSPCEYPGPGNNTRQSLGLCGPLGSLEGQLVGHCLKPHRRADGRLVSSRALWVLEETQGGPGQAYLPSEQQRGSFSAALSRDMSGPVFRQISLSPWTSSPPAPPHRGPKQRLVASQGSSIPGTGMMCQRYRPCWLLPPLQSP